MLDVQHAKPRIVTRACIARVYLLARVYLPGRPLIGRAPQRVGARNKSARDENREGA